MVTGSVASGLHGLPRTSQDVDLVIDPTPEQLDHLLSLLGDAVYVSPEAARDALSRRSMFNVIDFESGWKADLIVRKGRPFSIEEFQRRQTNILHGRPIPVATAEDVILAKLEWNRLAPSERQVNDVAAIVRVQGARLDQEYLRKWASTLGVSEELEAVLRQDVPPPV
jgi:hypothetical protein